MPLFDKIHCSASATAVNILGAGRSPNGSALSV